MKLIICEGKTDLEFIVQLFKVRGFELQEVKTEKVLIKEDGGEKKVEYIKVLLIRNKEKVQIVSVGGIDNIKVYLETRIKALLEQNKVKLENIIVIVDEMDFERASQKIKEKLNKYKLVKIPVNLEYYIANKLKQYNILKDLIEFWEKEWDTKIEKCKSKDIKELFYLFHSIILKNINPNDRCLRKVIKVICEKLGRRELEEIFAELGLNSYFSYRNSKKRSIVNNLYFLYNVTTIK